jgi:hypothetical protein
VAFKVTIKPKVIIPKHPVIRYARADLLDQSDTYRTWFEIFLALFMVLLGIHLSAIDPIPRMQWAFEITIGVIAAAAFLEHRKLQKEAREEADV